jgi:hypothetical protein
MISKSSSSVKYTILSSYDYCPINDLNSVAKYKVLMMIGISEVHMYVTKNSLQNAKNGGK